MPHCICLRLDQQSSNPDTVRITHYCDTEQTLIKELSYRLWQSRLTLPITHGTDNPPKPPAKDRPALLSRCRQNSLESKGASARKLRAISEKESSSGASGLHVEAVLPAARYERLMKCQPRLVSIKCPGSAVDGNKSWSSLDLLPVDGFTVNELENDVIAPDDPAVDDDLRTASDTNSKKATWLRKWLRFVLALKCQPWKQKYIKLRD